MAVVVAVVVAVVGAVVAVAASVCRHLSDDSKSATSTGGAPGSVCFPPRPNSVDHPDGVKDYASASSSVSHVGLEVVAVFNALPYCNCGGRPMPRPIEGEPYLRCFECLNRLPEEHPAALDLASSPPARSP